jgi:glycosyltransferase involved in cell wall biosynthesis
MFEVCPVPTLEAMACGKPLALLDIEPHKEIVEISKAGLTFSLNDELDFVKKIDHVYKNKMVYGDNARKFAVAHNWDAICRELTEIYGKLF